MHGDMWEPDPSDPEGGRMVRKPALTWDGVSRWNMQSHEVAKTTKSNLQNQVLQKQLVKWPWLISGPDQQQKMRPGTGTGAGI